MKNAYNLAIGLDKNGWIGRIRYRITALSSDVRVSDNDARKTTIYAFIYTTPYVNVKN